MKLSESIIIQSNREAIFDLTQDYDKRLLWDTFLKKAELIDTTEAGIGMKAWCVSKHGLGMETEYLSFKRPRAAAIKQSKPSLLFRRFSGSWLFKDADAGMVNVIFTYSYVLNFPFSIAGGFIHRTLISNVQQRLKDLKSCIEHGMV